MARFTFQARDAGGRAQRGVLEAASPGAVAQTLRQRGWLVSGIKATPKQKTIGEQLAALNPLEYIPPRSADIEMSCTQLAVMLRGGLTLLSSLQSVAEQTGNVRLRRIWIQIANRLQEGASFAEALDEARTFPKLLVQLARVGEQTGHLEQSVERAAETLESRRRLTTSLVTALAYPTIVLVAAIGVTTFMIVGVIPKLKIFLDVTGRKLPAMTQFLVDFSGFVNRYLPHFVVGILVLTAGAIALYLHPSGRLGVDRWLLRVPVLGRLFRLAGTASFARAMGILIRSGITVLEGLRTAEDLMANRYLATRIAAARQAVMQGGSLAEPLAARYAFTPMLGRLVAVGESAGTIDDVLDEVARYHESQLQAAIRTLSVIVEPVIIVVVGTIVGFVYISFFMALFAAGGA